MKKEILVKIICLAAALVIISVATVFVSDVGNHDTSDTVSRVFIDFSRSLSNVNDLLSSFLNAEEISEIRAIAQKFSEELKKARQDYNLLNVSGKKGTIDSFLNLSGDYVVSYAEEKISGTASAEQKAKLEKMKRFTGRFYEEISKIDANQSSAELTEKIRESYQKVNGEISREETALPVTSKVEDTLETEDNGNLLNNAKEVNHETALQMAASFIKTENAEVRSEMKNGIDVFCIIGSGEEVSVSKKGGYIVSLIRNDTEEIKNFDNEQCVQKAKDFLAEAFKVLTVARYLENDNETCYIVFTTKNGATFCNPDKIEITVAPKGFGSENMSRVAMLRPSDGIEGVKEFVIKAALEAGPNPCPPIVVGVGIGGTFDKAAYLAKKALIRSLDERNEDPMYADLEKELLEKINALGIGPQGFGGKTTALAVNVEKYPTHIAGLPVAVNINCHVTRHKTEVI